MNIDDYFPVRPSFSDADKVCFLNLLVTLGNHKDFKYLEVGSFLGGSLSFPLIYNKVSKVVSIDSRPIESPDERGITCHYAITTDQMKLNLTASGVPLEKLTTFDGTLANFSTNETFDFIFLDGEHTDESTFSDAVYALRILTNPGLIAFHDASLIHKAISNFVTLLSSLSIPYRTHLDLYADIYAIVFGDFEVLYHNLFESGSRDLSELRLKNRTS